MTEQTKVDPCGCVLIWDGRMVLLYPCILNQTSQLPGVVAENGVLAKVAI